MSSEMLIRAVVASCLACLIASNGCSQESDNSNKPSGDSAAKAHSRNTRSLNARIQQLSPPIVTTNYGKVRGIKVDVDNALLKSVVQYLGIPYARPPVGNLRWKDPVIPYKWPGIRNATKFGPVCPQAPDRLLPSALLPIWHRPSSRFRESRQRKMSEDCLYLNIYVPAKFYADERSRPNRYRKKLPVMIFFHGHTFSEGSANIYDGSVLANYGDVIVVTFNYRLGVLGFLSTLDSTAHGNYGLWDQVAMLRWVSSNIENFGGDRQRVTVFGAGSGAASIGILMLSHQAEGKLQGNVSEGYFKRAILQSGTALAPWAIVKQPRKHIKALATKLGCYNNSLAKVVTCLQGKSWRELTSVNVNPEPYNLAFGPVVDGSDRLLSETPTTLMNRHELLNYDVMVGVSQGEGFGYVQDRLNVSPEQYPARRNENPKVSQTIYTRKDFTIDVKKYVSAFYDESNIPMTVIEDLVQFLYTDWTDKDDPNLLKRSLMDLYTDRQWVEPAVQFAEVQTILNHMAFFYTFYHHPGSGVDRTWVTSGHGEELPFVFGAPLLQRGYPLFPYNFTQNDKMIATAVMTYWTNFARNGDPMVGDKQEAQFLVGIVKNPFENIQWPRYDTYEKQHLQIATKPQIKSHYRAQKVALWRSFLPRLTGAFCDFDCQITKSVVRSPVQTPFGSRTPALRPVTTTWRPNNKSLSIINNGAAKTTPSPDGGALSLQLSITLAVGFVLLFVNIIAFAVVSYHKERDKFRIEKLQSELKAYRQHAWEHKGAKYIPSAQTTLESCPEGGTPLNEPEVSPTSAVTFSKSNGQPPRLSTTSQQPAVVELEQTAIETRKQRPGNGFTASTLPPPPYGHDLQSIPEPEAVRSKQQFCSLTTGRPPRSSAAFGEASSAGSLGDVAFISNHSDGAWSNRNDVRGFDHGQTLPLPSKQCQTRSLRPAQLYDPPTTRFSDRVRCHSALGECYSRADGRRLDVSYDSSDTDPTQPLFTRSKSSRCDGNIGNSSRRGNASSALNLSSGYQHDPQAFLSTIPNYAGIDERTPLTTSSALPHTSFAEPGIRSVTTKL